LVFYRTIADLALNLLIPNGRIYFEINEKFGNELKDLLVIKGFRDITIRKDINGRDRMVRADT